MLLCCQKQLTACRKNFSITTQWQFPDSVWSGLCLGSATSPMRASSSGYRLAQCVTTLARSYSYSYLAERWTTVWINELVKTHLMCFWWHVKMPSPRHPVVTLPTHRLFRSLSLVTYPCHNDVVPSGCAVRQQHNRTTGRTWNSSKAAVFYSSNLCFLSFEKLKTSTTANSFLIVNNACLLFPQQWEPANTHIHKLTHRERYIWTHMQRGSACTTMS